jgi:hypothetical protein
VKQPSARNSTCASPGEAWINGLERLGGLLYLHADNKTQISSKRISMPISMPGSRKTRFIH